MWTLFLYTLWTWGKGRKQGLKQWFSSHGTPCEGQGLGFVLDLEVGGLFIGCLYSFWYKPRFRAWKVFARQGSGLHRHWDTGSKGTFECLGVPVFCGFLGNMDVTEMLVELKQRNRYFCLKTLISIFSARKKPTVSSPGPSLEQIKQQETRPPWVGLPQGTFWNQEGRASWSSYPSGLGGYLLSVLMSLRGWIILL